MSVAVRAPGHAIGHERRRSPFLLTRARAWPFARVLALTPWLLLTLFLAVELLLSSMQISGPFLDEGIYVTAGLRTLEGHGIADNYLSWFSGSLMWPVLAAVGWKAWGLAGARAVASVCVTAGLAAALKASGNIFNLRVRAAAALAAVTSGPIVALAHLAVYDALAVAAAGGAFWATSEFLRRDDRAWLCAAALLYALAGLAKYPVLLFIGPPLVLLVLVMRGRRARLDLGLFAFIAGALLLIYFLSDRSQLTAFEGFRVQENPNFHVSREQIAYSQLYLTIVPLSLAAIGVMLLSRRRLGLALLTGAIGAPVYHLLTGNPSGDQKHVVFGLLFMLPLIGVTLSHALRGRRMLLAVPALVGLSVFGLVQVVRIDEGWPDLRASASVLTHKVHPGERLLVNSSWVEAAYLYDRGRVDTPYDLYDVYRVNHEPGGVDICRFQWFVEVPGGESWSPLIHRVVRNCGTFKRVYSSSATVTGLGGDLRFVTYSAPIEIWRNERYGR